MAKQNREILSRNVFLNLTRIHDRLSAEFNALFKSVGLTAPSYNVLRILIGGPEGGVPCQYIVDRLLTRVPDVTRLVDRIVKVGLVTRSQGLTDRRIVMIKVTAKGRKVCRSIDGPIVDLHRAQFKKMPVGQLEQLNKSLAEIVSTL